MSRVLKWTKEHHCEKGTVEVKEDQMTSFGGAFDTIVLSELANNVKAWFAHNHEYATPILYCPFCGDRLENK